MKHKQIRSNIDLKGIDMSLMKNPKFVHWGMKHKQSRSNIDLMGIDKN
jgi:hypothetical protein